MQNHWSESTETDRWIKSTGKAAEKRVYNLQVWTKNDKIT